MISNKKLFCFQCKKCILNQQYSLCNSCNQNYHLQCFSIHSNNNSFKKWACLNCTEAESIFPFQSLNNSDFSGLFATDTNHNSNKHNTKKLNKLFTNMHPKVFNTKKYPLLFLIMNLTYAQKMLLYFLKILMKILSQQCVLILDPF